MRPAIVASLSLALLLPAYSLTVAQEKAPAKTKEPTAQEKAREKAEENYRMVCQPCHGPGGKSPLPDMSLVGREWKHGTSTEAIVKVIAEGVPGTAMLPNKQRFTQEEMVALARLVRSYDPKLKPEKK